MNCRDIALSSLVHVLIPSSPSPQTAEVLDYDEELNEFQVKVKGAWRDAQRWWVPCEDIVGVT